MIDRGKGLCESTKATSICLDLAEPFAPPDLDIDILINNAGINVSSGLTPDVSENAWDETLRVNLTAPFLFVKAFIPRMMAQGGVALSHQFDLRTARR